MNGTFECGDSGALVAYLYDECASDEREIIAAHVSRCETCATEIGTLNATRRTLAAWTPPELALGFQIARAPDAGAAANQPARLLEPNIAWWRKPMPAWAQAAAALVIFAAGLSIGVARNGTAGDAASSAAAVVPGEGRAAAASVSRDELAQLEQRIKTEMAQLRTSAAVPVSSSGARTSDEALIQQVKTLLDESEERQRREFTLRMVDLAGNIETQRRVDLATVRQSMGQQSGVIGTELRQQRQAIDQFRNYLINASEPAR